MRETLKQALNSLLADPENIAPVSMLVRLLASLVFGAIVAWIYTRTQRNSDAEGALPTTLVLLAVLIAMVTQVIGDNVARAFSLVGALSIVRFRTVVRDTRDTAFVIFAVAVGMAAGAQAFWLAAAGIAIGGSAAYAMSRIYRDSTETGKKDLTESVEHDLFLHLRAALGLDLESSLTPALKDFAAAYKLTSIATAKQGTVLEAGYQLRLQEGRTAEGFVREVNRIDGIQDVRLFQKGHEED